MVPERGPNGATSWAGLAGIVQLLEGHAAVGSRLTSDPLWALGSVVGPRPTVEIVGAQSHRDGPSAEPKWVGDEEIERAKWGSDKNEEAGGG